MEPAPSTRLFTVIAQDPSVRDERGGILTAQLAVPAETLRPGPWGHRMQVIDYDLATDTLYAPRRSGLGRDLVGSCAPSERTLLGDPRFHAQNVYAIAMSTLARFEFALGRRVAWGFLNRGHQLKLVPHAFAEANAFYSRRDEAVLFGYFPSRMRKGGTVFTCLSFDVVAHETTHALIDGLRSRYSEPSSPDQAAFHEGFADVVAMLAAFRMPEVVRAALPERRGRLRAAQLGAGALKDSTLLGLAEQLGEELEPIRGNPLRRSATLDPKKVDLRSEEFLEPHRRGEVFVAAMMDAFLNVWERRLAPLVGTGRIDRERVVEEGRKAADHLLTMGIRALDYAPPVDLTFGDFLSAVLTADREIVPDDAPYGYRDALRDAFGRFRIEPAAGDGGYWEAPPEVTYRDCHFEAMQRDPDELFGFVWENRDALRLHPEAYTYVQSVRPCHRIGPDGAPLRETVAEYVQILTLEARELRSLGLRRPEGMPADLKLRLYGGGALLFDDFGRLKFHVGNGVRSLSEQGRRRQSERIEYLWAHGGLQPQGVRARRFALLHRERALATSIDFRETW